MALKITLHQDFEEFVARLVASGRYRSESDVVNDALFCLRDSELLREAKLTALRAEIQKGFDSGPAEEFDPKELFEDIKRRGRERLATERQAAQKFAAGNG